MIVRLVWTRISASNIQITSFTKSDAESIDFTWSAYCVGDGTDQVCFERNYTYHLCVITANGKSCRNCAFIDSFDSPVYIYFEADCTNIGPMAKLYFNYDGKLFECFFGVFDILEIFLVADDYYPVCHGDCAFVPFRSSFSSSPNRGVATVVGVATGVAVSFILLGLLLFIHARRE